MQMPVELNLNYFNNVNGKNFAPAIALNVKLGWLF
jgi:hypothetical protein